MEDRTTVRLRSDAVSLGFRYEHGLVLFEGLGPGGLPLAVEFDTCTSPNAVRDGLVSGQGWPQGGDVPSSGVLAECEGREAEVPRIGLGDIEVLSLYALTDPLGGPASPDVMLGVSFLRQVVVRLDYAARTATFFRPQAWTPPPAGRDCVTLDLATERGGVPCLADQVTIHGTVRVPAALLDTGFNGAILLSGRLADAVGFREGEEGVRAVSGGGYGGPATLIEGCVRELSLGPILLRNVAAFRPTGPAGFPFGATDWAILGNRFFDRFVVTWALPQRKLVLESAGSFPAT